MTKKKDVEKSRPITRFNIVFINIQLFLTFLLKTVDKTETKDYSGIVDKTSTTKPVAAGKTKGMK